jgi:threonine dehydrogenase-like Zn-dependent dehydrogenase
MSRAPVRAFWAVAPGVGELRAEPAAPCPPEAVELRVLASGVSRGTESLVFAGRVPECQHAVMRAPLMGGEFPFPVKYGYAAVGVDAAGQRHFVLGPHQEHIAAPRHLTAPVPDDVPTPRAVLAANMETALNIVWDAAPLPGERVAVIGAGVVGLLTAYLLARFPAADVTVIDRDPARAELARRFGCTFALPQEAPAGRELIVHASGNEAGLQRALELAAFEARIIEASWFGARDISLPLGRAFHSGRLRLMSSQVGAVSPAMRGRRTHAERLALALRLLADPALDALLDGPTRFEDLPRAMPVILAAPGPLCHVITYGD